MIAPPPPPPPSGGRWVSARVAGQFEIGWKAKIVRKRSAASRSSLSATPWWWTVKNVLVCTFTVLFVVGGKEASIKKQDTTKNHRLEWLSRIQLSAGEMITNACLECGDVQTLCRPHSGTQTRHYWSQPSLSASNYWLLNYGQPLYVSCSILSRFIFECSG